MTGLAKCTIHLAGYHNILRPAPRTSLAQETSETTRALQHVSNVKLIVGVSFSTNTSPGLALY